MYKFRSVFIANTCMAHTSVHILHKFATSRCWNIHSTHVDNESEHHIRHKNYASKDGNNANNPCCKNCCINLGCLEPFQHQGTQCEWFVARPSSTQAWWHAFAKVALISMRSLHHQAGVRFSCKVWKWWFLIEPEVISKRGVVNMIRTALPTYWIGDSRIAPLSLSSSPTNLSHIWRASPKKYVVFKSVLSCKGCGCSEPHNVLSWAVGYIGNARLNCGWRCCRAI